MQFRLAPISILLAAVSTDAFAPSVGNNEISRSTKLHSSLAVSAEDINAKLAVQMAKLRKKDTSSPVVSKDVSNTILRSSK